MKIKYMIRMLIGLAVMASIVGVSPGNILKGQALDISILGVPDKDKKNITSTYVVSETGVLSLWMLEPMQVAGLTSDQLARKIEKAYKAKGLFTSPVLQVISSTAERWAN